MIAPPAFSESLGIIDLGSNSARLLVAHFTPGHTFKVTDELSRRVRLSEGMAATQQLAPAAIERALDTLRVFASFCKANGVRRVIPVATAAVRDARNQAEFLQRTQRETGLRLRVLTGEQEAYFSSLGAINSIGIQQGLVLDVGGGSAELGKVRAGGFTRGTVKPLGALSLTERYCHTDPVSDTDYTALNRYIANTLAPISWLRLQSGQQFVGLGGTVRTLARIDRATRSYPFHLVHQYELKLGRLEKLIDKLRGLGHKERARQTADIVAAQLGLPVTAHAGLVPGFSFPMLERLLNTRLQAGALLLVGHEDDFSQLIGRLMGGGRVVMKKGSLARVDLLQLQPPAGILSWLLPPKLLASE